MLSFRPLLVPRSRAGHVRPPRAWLLMISALVVSGCARGEALVPVSPADARQTAEGAAELSRLDGPYSLYFDWAATEAGLRMRGQGVARIQPPHHARLDLFTNRGERIAVAALVGDEVRIPPGAPDILPPHALLWGVLGVFRPGEESELTTGAHRGNDATDLWYRLPEDEELLYRLRNFRIHAMEVRRQGRTQEELRLVHDGERFPTEATYRDLVRVLELRFTLERVEDASSFPSRIWNPVP